MLLQLLEKFTKFVLNAEIIEDYQMKVVIGENYDSLTQSNSQAISCDRLFDEITENSNEEISEKTQPIFYQNNINQVNSQEELQNIVSLNHSQENTSIFVFNLKNVRDSSKAENEEEETPKRFLSEIKSSEDETTSEKKLCKVTSSKIYKDGNLLNAYYRFFNVNYNECNSNLKKNVDSFNERIICLNNLSTKLNERIKNCKERKEEIISFSIKIENKTVLFSLEECVFLKKIYELLAFYYETLIRYSYISQAKTRKQTFTCVTEYLHEKASLLDIDLNKFVEGEEEKYESIKISNTYLIFKRIMEIFAYDFFKTDPLYNFENSL
ncbi:hypothetical protein A0H76_2009 [Hepatospora eriocheir]|uniref:Uncharacterized protein n=1 Tax=Hepatospora eriocheir TaxID=1081669 RepID=A0A1X0QKD7_9MICR|nr:hypothetical protein A0H76_2009 [Hepatospora eriocheir]